MCLLGEAAHRLRHPIEEKGFRLLFGTVAIRRRDQLLGLGDCKRRKQIGKD